MSTSGILRALPCLLFNLLPLLFCAAITVSMAHAQTHGYGFIGPAFNGNPRGSAFRYGMGGAWATTRHITLGGEMGGIDSSGLLASGNAGVHFTPGKIADPFVTGGISYARSGGENAAFANIGGGLNYWFRSRIGARFEYRGYLGGQDLKNFSEFRFGVSFR